MDRASPTHDSPAKPRTEATHGREREHSPPEPHPAAAVLRARDAAGPLPPRDVLRAQGVVGNQAVQRLLHPRRPPAAAVTLRRPGAAVIARQDHMERGRAPSHPDQFEPEWSSSYVKKQSRQHESYEAYKATIGHHKDRPELKAASAWGGRQVRVRTTVTSDQLAKMVRAAGPEAVARIAPTAGKVSEAFETMGIDTAAAQAAYIAHYAGETGGKLEEEDGHTRSYWPFHGRGPVQVTHEHNYVQTLAYLELRAEQLEAQVADQEGRMAAAASPADREALQAGADRARAQAAELRKAHTEIKRDPRMAAAPRYAFLFSAAFMHMSRGVRASQWLGKTATFTGKGAEDFWTTGGSTTFADRLKAVEAGKDAKAQKDVSSAITRGGIKSTVYGAAVELLSRENAIGPDPPAGAGGGLPADPSRTPPGR